MASEIENLEKYKGPTRTLDIPEITYLKLEQMACKRNISANVLGTDIINAEIREAEEDPLNFLSQFGNEELRKLIFK